MDLTVVPPAGPQRAAALLEGHVTGQHALTQVLIVQAVVALLTLHRGLCDPDGHTGDGVRFTHIQTHAMRQVHRHTHTHTRTHTHKHTRNLCVDCEQVQTEGDRIGMKKTSEDRSRQVWTGVDR